MTILVIEQQLSTLLMQNLSMSPRSKAASSTPSTSNRVAFVPEEAYVASHYRQSRVAPKDAKSSGSSRMPSRE